LVVVLVGGGTVVLVVGGFVVVVAGGGVEVVGVAVVGSPVLWQAGVRQSELSLYMA
jgi:hypothetical protein